MLNLFLAATVSVSSLGAGVDEQAIDYLAKQQIRETGYPSLSVGIVRDQELVFARAYGTANREAGQAATPETVYRIGSITKVFTTTVMCMLRDEGKLGLDDPISKYLPADVKLPTDPRGAPAITLRHLATHTSGLPRMPSNFVPTSEGAWAGYTAQQLYEGLPQTRLIHPIGAECAYSNLGVGLLGHILTRITNQPYDQMLDVRLLRPLGMTHTGCRLSADQQKLLAIGYVGEKLDQVAKEDDFGCLAGCGDLASNVPDLAKFLALQMRAGQAGVKPVSGGTLAELHTPQRIMEKDWSQGIGLGWITTPALKELPEMGDIVWHNGGTEGYFSWISFLPEHKIGVIVLTNGFKPVDAFGFILQAAAFKQLRGAGDSTADLPKAESVLDGFVEATGGAKAYEAIRTIIDRGKAELAGISATFEDYGAAPNKYYGSMKAAGRVIYEEGTDGETVWEKGILQAPTIKSGKERAMMLREADFLQHVHWRQLYKKVHCTKRTRFNDHDCYEIEVTPREGDRETRYYDVGSKLLIGVRQNIDIPPFGEEPVETMYDDYRAVAGVKRPFSIVQSAGDVKSILQIESSEANVDIPASRFELPAEVKKLRVKKISTRPASAPGAASWGQ